MSDKNKATRNKEEDPMLGVTADYRQVRPWKTALIGLALFLSMTAAVQGRWQQPGEIEQLHGKWQVPGRIQQPKGPWQTPGAPGAKGYRGDQAGELPLSKPDRGRRRRAV